MNAEVSDAELKKVIADFLEMGHVDNIVEMFKRDPLYYSWAGELLDDERFGVRLGMTVLFEELKRICPDDIERAVPSLSALLLSSPAYVRGEAVSILGIIGTPVALQHVEEALKDDSPQVREVAGDVLEECA